MQSRRNSTLMKHVPRHVLYVPVRFSRVDLRDVPIYVITCADLRYVNTSNARPHTMRYLVFRCYNEQAHLFRMHYSQAASQCRCEKMLAPLQHLKCRCMLKHGIPHQNAPQMHRLADHTVASERKDVVCFLRVSVLGSKLSMFASCLGELSNVI